MITCPHCGKEFDEKKLPKGKWYFSNYWVVVFLLCLGPFALPLVWFNPRYKPMTKWIITIIVIVITVWGTIKSIELFKAVNEQLKSLDNLSLGY